LFVFEKLPVIHTFLKTSTETKVLGEIPTETKTSYKSLTHHSTSTLDVK